MPTRLRLSCRALLIIVLVGPNCSSANSGPVSRRVDSTVPPPQSVTERVTERRTASQLHGTCTCHLGRLCFFSSFNSPGGRTIGSLYANDRFAVLTVFFNLVHSSVSIYTLLVSILFELFSYVFVFMCVEKCFVRLKFRRFNIMCMADCSFHSRNTKILKFN